MVVRPLAGHEHQCKFVDARRVVMYQQLGSSAASYFVTRMFYNIMVHNHIFFYCIIVCNQNLCLMSSPALWSVNRSYIQGELRREPASCSRRHGVCVKQPIERLRPDPHCVLLTVRLSTSTSYTLASATRTLSLVIRKSNVAI